MSPEQIHRAVSDDGTEIVGTVHGQGPPLVLVHGAMDDGQVSWRPSLPYLTDRFTCHVPSIRNRGRSGWSDDSTPERLVDDVTAYVASLDEPVGLVGLSLGGALVLGAATRLENVTALVAYEPTLREAMSEDDLARFAETARREAAEAEQERPGAAIRTFGKLVGNDEEMASLEEAGAFEVLSRNVLADLAVIQQGSEYQGPRTTDVANMTALTIPVLLLQGRRSNFASWFHASVRHAAEHIPDATVHEFDGLGHLAPMVAPQPVATEIVRYFEQVGAHL